MILLYTFLACLALYALQAWLLPKTLVAATLPFAVSSRLVEPKGTEADAEDPAALDLRRARHVARLSRFGVIVRECVSWLGALFVIYLASEHWGGAVNWNSLYGLSLVLFLLGLKNTRGLKPPNMTSRRARR